MKLGKALFGVALAVSLLAGCSRKPSADATAPKALDLGTLELTSGQPSRHEVGGGEDCVITANALDASTLELVVVLEKNGKRVAFSRANPISPDQPLDTAIGDVQLHFTPHIK
jgi:hypothetical protein